VYHVYLWHGISVYWYIKTLLEPGSVGTADLTNTYKLLRNNITPDQSQGNMYT